MNNYNYIATASFGLEATVKREVIKLGYSITSSSDGRIEFSADLSAIPKTNLWLRSADRVQLKMGEFYATSFDELFENTKALPWDELIPRDGKFTVTGKSVKSQLFSVPDCQSIVKKAVVEKLKKRYTGVEFFEETGAEYTIQVALLRDKATLTVDTTGPGLNKRGYRPLSTAAPIKETMAAALIELSYWKRDRPLLDPFCGGGTIAIEAAFIARNIAPGLTRSFASEGWEIIPKELWRQARKDAYSAIDASFWPDIYARDIDPKAIEAAKRNARAAGVDETIRFEVCGVEELTLPAEYGVVITNPPYGERMGETSQLRALYRDLAKPFKADKTWSVYVITADEEFEKYYGRKADAKRKLFSGMIKTDYYQFYGERPPKK